MDNAVSYLTVLPANRDEINSFTSRVVTELEGGVIDPLELRRNIKAIEIALEAIKEKARDIFVDEAQKYGKEFSYAGADFKVGEYGIKYNYKGTGDPVWAKLSEMLKQREEYLRSMKEVDYWTDEETGEIYKITPPVKTSTTSVSVNIK